MSKYGIKASFDNNNVSSALPNNLNLSSLYNTLKIFDSGYGTASVPTLGVLGGPRWEQDITHNLGYKPIILFYYKHPETSQWHKAVSVADANTGTTWDLYGYYSNTDVNTTQLVLYDGLLSPMPSSPTNVDYKYYILIEPRQDAWYE